MVKVEKWEKGKRVTARASSINHEDAREITLEYLGEGVLRDISNGNEVSFNDTLFPNVFEGMYISLGLMYNSKICESYEIVRIE